MKSLNLAACLVVLAVGDGVVVTGVAAAEVVTSDLKIAVPGKVDFVSWSVQEGHCLVQISFPSVRTGVAQPKHAKIQAWLLRADGTSIPQMGKMERGGVSNAGFDTDYALFRFPEFARTEAMGVVVSVDGQLFAVALKPEAK